MTEEAHFVIGINPHGKGNDRSYGCKVWKVYMIFRPNEGPQASMVLGWGPSKNAKDGQAKAEAWMKEQGLEVGEFYV